MIRDPNRSPATGPEWNGSRASDVPVEPRGTPNPLEAEPEKPVTNGHNPVDDDFPPTDSTPLSPNRIDVNRHLGRLFPPEFVQDYPDSWIEIAFADPGGNGKPNAAEHFSAFDIAGAAEFAIKKNAAGFNIYVGPALRHGKSGANSNGRASGANFLASLHQWVDFEKPGDDMRINASLEEKNLLTTMTVVTGNTPNFRAHLYFKISGKATKDQVHDVNTALKKWLGTDDVQDPCRVMRLAGTVSYPPPDKVGRGYIPELVTLYPRKNAPSYSPEQLLGFAGKTSGAFGFDTAAKQGRTDDEIIEKLEASCMKGKWHDNIRDAIATMIGRNWSDLQIRLACAHYCTGGANDPDLNPLIEGARKKWNKPDDEPGAHSANDYTAEFAVEPIDPVDLWAKFDPPTLPRGLLPQVIEEFAFDRGRTMGCDMGGIAVGALAVCAAAITDTIRIKPKKFDTEWQESARLWVALIGPVSAMKTPMLKAAAKPLQAIDNVLARDYQREMAAYNRLPKEEKQQREKPLQIRVMAQDVTIEATQDILQDSPAGILYYSDELSGWFGSMDKYSGARGSAKDRAFWLESYNGGSYTVDRVQRGTVFVDHLSVSMLGGIQPETICRIAGDSIDDGLLQRFMPIMVSPAAESQDEPPSEVGFDYSALIRKLHELKPPMTGGLMKTVAPLTFDDGAMAIRKELERKHRRLQQCESINQKLAAHIGKYNGIFARLCVVWHCVEHAGGDSLPAVVTADTARRVAGFLHSFLLPHALAFYAGVLGLSNDHDQLSDIASYILARKLEKITNRDVQRGSKGMRSLKQREVEGLFEQLDAFGWLTRVPGPRPSYPHHWVVNPVVHQKFAKRAEAEKKRREQDHATLAELFGGKNA